MDRQIAEEPLSSIFRRLLQQQTSTVAATATYNNKINYSSNPNVASLELLLPRLCGLARREVRKLFYLFVLFLIMMCVLLQSK